MPFSLFFDIPNFLCQLDGYSEWKVVKEALSSGLDCNTSTAVEKFGHILQAVVAGKFETYVNQQ